MCIELFDPLKICHLMIPQSFKGSIQKVVFRISKTFIPGKYMKSFWCIFTYTWHNLAYPHPHTPMDWLPDYLAVIRMFLFRIWSPNLQGQTHNRGSRKMSPKWHNLSDESEVIICHYLSNFLHQWSISRERTYPTKREVPKNIYPQTWLGRGANLC